MLTTIDPPWLKARGGSGICKLMQPLPGAEGHAHLWSKAPKMDQSVEGGGGDSGGTKEKCTDDPNFAVMVAFLQVHVLTKGFFYFKV